MAYDLEDLCRDCHEILDARARAPPSSRRCASRSRASSPTRRSSSGPAAPRRSKGCTSSTRTASLGFQVLAHINEKPRVSPPHNHGESWAVYGQATGYTDMTEFRRVDDGADPAHAKLEVTRKYRLNPGEVGIYASTAIHSIDYPAKSRFIRITGTNLDRIYRDAFDPATGAIKRMAPQQAS